MATTEANKIRCGWCLDGNHDHCAVVIRLSETRNTKFRCPCGCNTTGHYTPEHPRTRCLDCGRRDVPTTDDRCTDTDECADFIAKRRANNPEWQAIQTVKLRRSAEDTAAAEVKQTAREIKLSTSEGLALEPRTPRAPRTPATPTRCRCCDGPTKGGQFLPGHDARYVSQQAELIVGGRRDLLVVRLDDLSPHLFAKLTKRVELLEGKMVSA